MALMLERSANGRQSESRPSLIRRISVSYKLTLGSAEQLIYGGQGLPARMERLLGQIVDFGALPLAEKILARFTAVVEQRPAPALDDALMLAAQDADADEDKAELAFHLDPSDANLERYARKSEKEAYLASEKALALRAEQKRRAGR